MSVHNKTKARAKRLGVRLIEDGEGNVTAKIGKHTVSMAEAEASKAIDEVVALFEQDPDRAATLRALAMAKPRYKAQGDVNNCGDWLAKLLKEHFLEDEGKKKAVFQMDDFIACLKANDVPLEGRWTQNRNRGWEGRFRMNGRQKLEKVIAATGGVIIEGEMHRAPNVFIKEMRERHPDVEVAQEAA